MFGQLLDPLLILHAKVVGGFLLIASKPCLVLLSTPPSKFAGLSGEAPYTLYQSHFDFIFTSYLFLQATVAWEPLVTVPP
jgi:hypothetical protein